MKSWDEVYRGLRCCGAINYKDHTLTTNVPDATRVALGINCVPESCCVNEAATCSQKTRYVIQILMSLKNQSWSIVFGTEP